MKDNFDQCFALVLKEEGGYTNHPKDPGGRTNLGITQKTWEMWTGKPATEEDMKNLTPKDAAPIYKQEYWDKVKGDELPEGVDYAVFDMAVNAGVSRAIKTLQKCLGVNVDGILGPKTMAAVEASYKHNLISDFCDARLQFLQALPTWDTFGKGWGSRVSRVEKIAFSMAV
jgi:hypothetical protein